MGSKWTSGPWTSDVEDESIGSIDSIRGDRVAQAQPIPGDGLKQVVRKANACLIAAAPDLYEALKNIVDSIAVDGCAGSTTGTQILMRDALAALARARGEQ